MALTIEQIKAHKPFKEIWCHKNVPQSLKDSNAVLARLLKGEKPARKTKDA